MSHTLSLGQWILALAAALDDRGTSIDLATLSQAELDDLTHRYRMGDTPERAADVICGRRPVPLPWVPEGCAS